MSHFVKTISKSLTSLDHVARQNIQLPTFVCEGVHAFLLGYAIIIEHAKVNLGYPVSFGHISAPFFSSFSFLWGTVYFCHH